MASDDVLCAIRAICEYLEPDEKKNWEESDKPQHHIYNDIQTVYGWLNEDD